MALVSTTSCGQLSTFKESFMSKHAPIKPADNTANMQNKNAGSPGTNRQYDQNQGNRGKDMNPNRK
ncbi:hypothetical protein, partial [Aeromonas veronii]|uniref:hypothetical protein n=2 Tax=Aeromonas veronii TaxID=654 RepID=UPI003CE573B5